MNRTGRAAILFLTGVAALGPGCRPAAQDATLRVLLASDVLTLDPNSKFEIVTDTLAMNLFEPLLRFDSHMNLQPALAARWENPDELTWRLHLRPGVRFHDGSPFTADDVVFSFDRVLRHPDSEVFPFLAGVRRVTAESASTVLIVTERPTPLLPRLAFVYILPKRVMGSMSEEEFFRRPVGTGPYRLAARDSSGKNWTLEAFQEYWGGAPPVGRSVFETLRAGDDPWSALRAGGPAILVDAPRKGWDQHLGDRDLRLIERPGLTVSYLGFTLSPRPGNPLADIRVRRAVRLALDVKTLIARALPGHAFPATQFVPPDVVGYNPDLGAITANPAESRRWLAEAGYPDGLDLTLDYQWGGAKSTVDEIARQLGAAGIRVRPKIWPKDSFFSRIDRGESPFHFTGWNCSSGESAELFETSFHTRQPNLGLGRDNGIGYSNSQVDRLTEEILSTVDAAARVELEKRAMAVTLADLPWIPIFIQQDRYALTQDVAWEPRADGELWLPDVQLHGRR